MLDITLVMHNGELESLFPTMKPKILGQVFSAADKTLLGTPASPIRVPGFDFPL